MRRISNNRVRIKKQFRLRKQTSYRRFLAASLVSVIGLTQLMLFHFRRFYLKPLQNNVNWSTQPNVNIAFSVDKSFRMT